MNIKPDWNEISSKIGDNLSDEEMHQAWSFECNKWLEALVSEFGDDYRIEQTPNFSIMSNETDRYIQLFGDFLERTLKRVLATLEGMACDEGFGKYVVLIFKDSDQYYDYIDMFFPEESEIGFSSGMYINEGYGHFVFPSQVLDYAEPIAVHELTHACLAHLPIPLWLNEGIAVLMEDVLAGRGLYLDKELLNRHQAYWNNDTIQSFWSGESFFAIGDGQELSYNLAHVLVRNISKDFQSFVSFTNSANFGDAGDSAAIEYLGFTLNQIVGSFLGEGDWRLQNTINN